MRCMCHNFEISLHTFDKLHISQASISRILISKWQLIFNGGTHLEFYTLTCKQISLPTFLPHSRGMMSALFNYLHVTIYKCTIRERKWAARSVGEMVKPWLNFSFDLAVHHNYAIKLECKTCTWKHYNLSL